MRAGLLLPVATSAALSLVDGCSSPPTPNESDNVAHVSLHVVDCCQRRTSVVCEIRRLVSEVSGDSSASWSRRSSGTIVTSTGARWRRFSTGGAGGASSTGGSGCARVTPSASAFRFAAPAQQSQRRERAHRRAAMAGQLRRQKAECASRASGSARISCAERSERAKHMQQRHERQRRASPRGSAQCRHWRRLAGSLRRCVLMRAEAERRSRAIKPEAGGDVADRAGRRPRPASNRST
jgi:hypothetical protein